MDLGVGHFLSDGAARPAWERDAGGDAAQKPSCRFRLARLVFAGGVIGREKEYPQLAGGGLYRCEHHGRREASKDSQPSRTLYFEVRGLPQRICQNGVSGIALLPAANHAKPRAVQAPLSTTSCSQLPAPCCQPANSTACYTLASRTFRQGHRRPWRNFEQAKQHATPHTAFDLTYPCSKQL
jgi:hypothetical protein